VPTIREVALHAGVSVGTVSNVLGGSVPVSKRLRERVLRVIAELNYQPNHLARSLKIRRTGMVGMVIGDVTDQASPQMLRGAEDAAWLQNYVLVALNADRQWERERQIVTALRTHRVDGILLATPPGTEEEHIRAVRDAGIPIVCLEREIPGLGLDCVVARHFEGARECVKHLASFGHRSIGWIPGAECDATRERFDGYRRGLQDAGLGFDETLVAPVPRLLARDPRPTAIVAPDVRLAAALLRTLDQRDLRCPRDIAVATFGDSWLCEALSPMLTAVAQPSYEMGFRAMELLIQRIHEPERRRTKIVVETTLHMRESSGALHSFGLAAELRESASRASAE
jgi:DNA-binding LacI/PurR family transcriptional regulator